jgi:hypothetical protein
VAMSWTRPIFAPCLWGRLQAQGVGVLPEKLATGWFRHGFALRVSGAEASLKLSVASLSLLLTRSACPYRKLGSRLPTAAQDRSETHGGGAVGDLAAGQQERDRAAEAIGQRVDFRRPSAA